MPNPDGAGYRKVQGLLLAKGIPFINGLSDKKETAEKQILRGISKSKDDWSHPQVAIRNLDLASLGFKPTRMALPLPGERIGTTSWRSGPLHAHKMHEMFLVHKDGAGPSGFMDTLQHAVVDVPKTLPKYFRADIRPPVMPMKEAAAPVGFYKGQPTSPHTVKFKTDFQGIPINVDRPKGFIMRGMDAKGNDWARRYKYDYGFIPKTLGGDDDGLDVFIGPNKKSPVAFWAVQRKEDGSFDEYKVFLGFENRDEATAAYRQHIPKKLFNGIMSMKVEMMKSMLGKVNPEEKMKRASAFGFIDELGWLMGHSA